MTSEWDEYSGQGLAVEAALDARGAAAEIEHLRCYRAAYAEAETRIKARIGFLQELLASLADPESAHERARRLSEIEGLQTALIHLDRSLTEVMAP